MADYTELNDDNFASEGKSHAGVLLVDFWADWCVPCKAIAPMIENLAKKYADNPKVKIAKVDTDSSPKTAEEFEIMSIPNIKVFINKDGTEGSFEFHDQQNGFVGPATEKLLENKIEAALAALG